MNGPFRVERDVARRLFYGRRRDNERNPRE